MAGTIPQELQRLKDNISAAYSSCGEKGASLPSDRNSDNLAGAINSIQSASDIPEKDSGDMTVSGATVTAPAGWYKSAASKSVATATQATPSITVSDNGLITASATQSAGYVSAGTKSATQQLTVETWTIELESGSTTEKVVVV